MATLNLQKELDSRINQVPIFFGKAFMVLIGS